jgi:predicted secreted protein
MVEDVPRLHYVRSWEKPAADETQFDLRVVVE